MTAIVQQPGFVTSDSLARLWVPGADPAAALAEAERLARRRMADTLQHLRDRRSITAAELRAGHEIAVLWAWQDHSARPMVRSQFAERLAASTSGHSVALALLDAEDRRFIPWRTWAGAFPVSKTSTLLDLARRVAVEGEGIRRAGRACRIGDHRGVPLLRRALHNYARRAGWARGENPENLAGDAVPWVLR